MYIVQYNNHLKVENKGAGSVTRFGKCLLGMCKTLCQCSAPQKSGMVPHAAYPSTREMEEVEAGRSDVQGYPWLYSGSAWATLMYTHLKKISRK